MNDVIVSVRAMKIDADQPAPALALRRGVEQEVRQADLEQAQQAQAERQEEPGDAEVQPGVIRQVLAATVAEKKNETEHADRREDADDRQAVRDRQAGRLALPSVCPCLTKKLTVIGTIGQTQGITRANSPPSAEAIRNGIKPCLRHAGRSR